MSDVNQVVGAKVFLKSTLCSWLKPQTTNLALCFTTTPSAFVFWLKTHFDETARFPEGKSTSLQTLICFKMLISLSQVSVHCWASSPFIANLYDCSNFCAITAASTQTSSDILSWSRTVSVMWLSPKQQVQRVSTSLKTSQLTSFSNLLMSDGASGISSSEPGALCSDPVSFNHFAWADSINSLVFRFQNFKPWNEQDTPQIDISPLYGPVSCASPVERVRTPMIQRYVDAPHEASVARVSPEVTSHLYFHSVCDYEDTPLSSPLIPKKTWEG